MIFDLVQLNRKSEMPLYRQLYEAFREAIETGQMPYGVKLPSIRKLSEDLKLSRTTVETAYQQLCVEGYIESVPQSGYYVQARIKKIYNAEENRKSVATVQDRKISYRYNLGSDCIDASAPDIKLWRSYIKGALKREKDLISYGEPQGESVLREQLAIYGNGARGLHADSRNIVIGAGTQPLLYLLGGLLLPFGRKIAMESGGFARAEQVFEDCGYTITHWNSDDNDFIKNLYASDVRIIFVNPSGNLRTGQPMRMNRRIELLEWARQTNGIIIEDDYNGELRYTAHPIPALQASDEKRVIYIGSFSKLLLPSVRIGYMVLPDKLLESYRTKIHAYNQTASKIEQTALAEYIRQGHLERRLRKLRKLYNEKSEMLISCLQKRFSSSMDITLHETSLYITVCLHDTKKDLCAAAQAAGVRVSEGENSTTVRLGFAGIALEDISAAVDTLRHAWQ
ncbi:MAG: PLP-dependent aminotransferase family protein [Acutalibacteraceae bacterium]